MHVQRTNKTAVPATSNLIPAVAYLRMSSSQQEGSIEQQDNEVDQLARRAGYLIIHKYVEEPITGTREDRPQWQRLLLDSRKHEFETVLMWKVNRLGRVHPLTAAGWKDTLRKNGVTVHTVCEGILDWETLAGLITDLLQAQEAQQYSINLGEDSVRGRVALIGKGRWPNGAVPYGYDNIYLEPDGTEHKVARSAPFRKPRLWDRVLVANEAEAATVKLVFKEWLERDTSLRALAQKLSLLGKLPPSGQHWTKDTIKDILRRKAYAGFAIIGGGRQRQKTAHHRTGYHESAGAIPALVTLQEWEEAQARLAQVKRHPQHKPGNASCLSGVLVCGHCGYRMAKHERTDAQGNRYAYFTCDSAMKRPGKGCRQWRVREEEVLPLAVGTLVKELDRRFLEEHEAQPEEALTPDIEGLTAKLKELEAQIAKGNERYLKAPSALQAGLEKALLSWVDEGEEIKRRIENLTIAQGDITSFAKWWEGVKGNLVEVIPGRTVLAQDEGSQWDEEAICGVMMERDKLRGLLKSLGLKVTLYFKPKGTRYWQIDHARVEATLTPPEYAVGVPSSTRTRARSPGTG